MMSHQRQIALETQRALIASEADHLTDRSMKNFQRRQRLSNSLVVRPESWDAISEADLGKGDSFNEASSKAMIPSPPFSSRHIDRSNDSPNAMAQAQASYALSFTQSVNGTLLATASESQCGVSSSAGLASHPTPQNVNITFQVPGNQQLDFVETRTTPDGAFVMKWAYRPAHVESHPRLLSSAPDHGVLNDARKTNARKSITRNDGAPIRSRKPAIRNKVPKSDIPSVDQCHDGCRDNRSQRNAPDDMSRAKNNRSDLDRSAADEDDAKFQHKKASDLLRRKFSLGNLLTAPPSIGDDSIPASPQRTIREDVLSVRYRNASDRMEKAITSLQRELLGEVKYPSDQPTIKDDLSLSHPRRCLSRRRAEIPDRVAISSARQPTPHPDLGKMLNNGRTSNAGRSHKHLQTANRSLRPARNFAHDPWLDAAAPVSPGKENRCPDSRAEKEGGRKVLA
jgi:hypothetical protein